MGEEDIAAVATLLRAAERADRHAPLGEHKWIDLVQGGRAGFAGFVARCPGSAELAGYAQLSRGHGSWAVEYVVHPAARAVRERVVEDLLRAAIGEIALSGGGHVHVWVPKPDAADDAVARSVGLAHGREIHQMRRALPLGADLAGSARATLRPFVVGEDEAARQAGRADAVVLGQLAASLPEDFTAGVVGLVAYEPIWAISTFGGELAKPADIQKAMDYIRYQVSELFGTEIARQVRVLYGGSVDPYNCASYLALDGCDGTLVGGASLNYEQFTDIVKKAYEIRHKD